MSNFICKKCGSTEYEIKDKPNGTGVAHGLYCAKCGFWHKWLGKEELRQYAKKDSKDEIISRLQDENAALRERLDKAVELPCKVGDVIYIIAFGYNGKPITEDNFADCFYYEIEEVEVTEDNLFIMCSHFRDGSAFTDRAAAEKRLAELGGEKNND